MPDEAPHHQDCSHDPRTLTGHPIGMYNCPECDEMVIAGMKHLDYRRSLDDQRSSVPSTDMLDEAMRTAAPEPEFTILVEVVARTMSNRLAGGDTWPFLDSMLKERWRGDAHAALAAVFTAPDFAAWRWRRRAMALDRARVDALRDKEHPS